MKNRNTILSLSSLALMLMFVAFAGGCNKKFDEPNPLGDTSNIPQANTTIAQLRALGPASGQMIQLSGGKIIRGVVVGNDRTGNIYKQLFIQDNTGGMMLEINALNMYNQFPVGREVAIVTDGLWLANETGMLKLAVRVINNGTPALSGIPSTLIDRYIKRGALNRPIDTIKISSVSQLNNDYQSRLIRLENFEVVPADLNKTFSDTSVNKANTNINFQNCSGQSIIVRTSGFANFAGVKVPQGNGPLIGIYTVFNATKQLIVRDTTDTGLMTGPRCGTGVNPNLVFKTLAEIRAMALGTVLPANTGIRGTIVSNTQNEATGNYRIQDGSGAGVQIRFTANNPAFLLNDSVKIDVSGLTVDEFQGDRQINNVTASEKIGTATVTPRVTTVSEINTNASAWASTVVTLNNVTIAQTNTTTAGINYAITDATGTISTHIRTTLGYTPPPAATTLTGYVSLFNGTPQITLRIPGDVVAGTNPFPTVTTTAVTSITQTTATSGGNVTAAGTSTVTARGVVWSTAQAPTVALSTKTTDGSGTGSFVSSITGLTANTTYYVRAYATNASGTAYGNEVTFTTQTTSGGTVTTETFETGTKTSYAAASVTLGTGPWMFSDAILGDNASDIKNGNKAARIRGTVGSNNGFIETEFAITGLKKVTLKHAQTNFFEGTGTMTVSFEVQVSKNGGAWTKVGNTVNPTLGTLNTAEFLVNAAAGESVKVRILNTSGASIQTPTNQVRINIDDVQFEQ